MIKNIISFFHFANVNFDVLFAFFYMCRNVRKLTFGHVRPAKILISLRISTGWSESSLGTFLKKITHFDIDKSKNLCFNITRISFIQLKFDGVDLIDHLCKINIIRMKQIVYESSNRNESFNIISLIFITERERETDRQTDRQRQNEIAWSPVRIK